MGIYKLVLPKMGESVSEATITNWVKRVGEHINEDDTVAEVATDKVDSEVPSPVSGTLSKILFEPNQVAQVGDIIAWIEVDGYGDSETSDEQDIQPSQPTGAIEDAERVNEDTPVIEDDAVNLAVSEEMNPEDAIEPIVEVPGTELLVEKAEENSPQNHTLRFYSPLVRNIAQQEGLTQTELDSIVGTGSEGRVTKQDIFDFLAGRKVRGVVHATTDSERATSVGEQVFQIPSNEDTELKSNQISNSNSTGDEIIEMDRMRKLIADHMVHSVKTSPHVASFVEADVTKIVNWRNKWKDNYKTREGENITFTPIFIEAICKALKDFPMVNVSIDGYNIIKKKDINIGMAAALPSGNLIVPVIQNADQLSLVGLSKSVNDLANRSRQNKLKPDEIQGGTFTFTNIGAFGNIMGVPIINQPQAAILAVGAIKKRPAVIETEDGDVIAIRHMMYISMSYDHRIIDGALGGTFLKRVADYLEQWDTNRVI